MSYLAPSTSSLQSTETIGQGPISGESQRHRYASFSCSDCQLVTKRGPRATVHILRRSTSSTMIHSLTYFISIDRPSLTGTRMVLTVWKVGGDGIANDGGTNSHKFAKDGETSFLAQHPTWVFPSSVHMARQLQTCWHIHLPFLSSWITMTPIWTSLQKMKRE
jgi:hypothetical protein